MGHITMTMVIITAATAATTTTSTTATTTTTTTTMMTMKHNKNNNGNMSEADKGIRREIIQRNKQEDKRNDDRIGKEKTGTIFQLIILFVVDLKTLTVAQPIGIFYHVMCLLVNNELE
jgi:hypothetical protein